MTCIIAGVGLLPAAMSSGIGSQVQKPLAVVVVGGMMLAPLLILVILPVLILIFSAAGACRNRHSAGAGRGPQADTFGRIGIFLPLSAKYAKGGQGFYNWAGGP